MKYIITAKDVYRGTSGDDSANPLLVTEICSELIITRLYLLDLLARGEISSSDTVVTIEDRFCLYTEIFGNVISFKNFSSLQLSENDEVIDLLENSLYIWLANLGGIVYKPFYKNYERDKSLIESVDWGDLEDYHVNDKFAALVVRKRGAWPEKNLSDEYWKALIVKLRQRGVQVFVFGKETESMCDGDGVQYIKNYKDWCSLVRHKNCAHIFSTMTGGVYPALIFGAPNMRMTIIDNTGLMSLHGGDPSFYDDCINFSKVKIEFIDHVPTIDCLYGRFFSSF